MNKLIFTCLFFLFAFGNILSQDVPSQPEIYKRGVIKVRKPKAEIVILNDSRIDQNTLLRTNQTNNNTNIVYESPCNSKSWMRPRWKMVGFVNKRFSREYVIDELIVEDCENVKLIYYDDGDTTVVESTMRFKVVRGEQRITFNFVKDGEYEEIFFDYSLDIKVEDYTLPSNPDSIIYDTVSTTIHLWSEQKEKKYDLVDAATAYDDGHNHFPGICKKAQDTVNQWISDTRDADGYKHKIIFRSCSQIEIHYRNPAKKNRIEKIEITQDNDNHIIELFRQRIDMPDKYFNASYKVEIKDDKMILSNEVERFTYSIHIP